MTNDYLMVHAGVLPMWDADRVMRLAAEASAAINGEQWYAFAKVLYGDMPDNWLATLQGFDRFFMKVIPGRNIAAFSRTCANAPPVANRFVPLGVCQHAYQPLGAPRYPRKCQKRQSNRYAKDNNERPRRTSGREDGFLKPRFERAGDGFFPSVAEYFRDYGMTAQRLKALTTKRRDVMIMHPVRRAGSSGRQTRMV